jgi:glc operon protein GlcG
MRSIAITLAGILSRSRDSSAFVSTYSGLKSGIYVASATLRSSYLDNLGSQASPNSASVSYSSATSGGYLGSLAGPPLATGGNSASFSSTTTASSSTQSNSHFDHVPILSLDHADTIADNVISCIRRNGFNPITVYVLDQSGSTLVSKRMDGCSPVGMPEFAKAKAFSCIVNKYPSRAFRDRYTANGNDDSLAKFGQMLGMVAISQGQMATFPGGIVVKLGEHVIGAVGVSGAAGDEDEYCAIRGVVESQLGLSTVPEQHSCATVKDNL